MENLIEYDPSGKEKFDPSRLICANNAGHYYITTPYYPIIRPNGRNDYQIIYVKSGRVKLTEGKREKMVESGNIIFFKPQEPQYYTYQADRPCEVFWVHFYGTLVDEAVKNLRLDDFRTLFVGSNYKITKYIEAILVELITNKFGKSYTSAGNVLLLLTEIANTKSDVKTENNNLDHNKFREVLLQMHNLKSTFSLREFAAISKMSASRFSHSFKETFGQSPYSYYLNIRLNYAKTLLLDTTFSISEIAAQLGYIDSFYFSRLFKKHVGVPPLKFRQTGKDLM